MELGYRVQSWADQALQQKLIKSRNIRIIQIESKWSAPLTIQSYLENYISHINLELEQLFKIIEEKKDE